MSFANLNYHFMEIYVVEIPSLRVCEWGGGEGSQCLYNKKNSRKNNKFSEDLKLPEKKY